MKREGYIYDRICSYNNIELAHRNARKDKHFYREVQEIDANPRPYLLEIQRMLVEKTYEPSSYTIFEKFDSGKVRQIYKLPYYPDRIIHWAVIQQTEHLFMRVYTDNTHAAIKGRGIHSAMQQVKYYTSRYPSETRYCLKIDVRKFFPSINHVILKHLLRKIIKCPDTLWINDKFIDSLEGTAGVPIGNYPSQYYADIYLGWFDHWCKEVLHIKFYTRYMDDIVILSSDKEQLWRWLNKMRLYLKDELFLEIKGNYAVFPVGSRPIDFTGYKNWGVVEGGESSKITLRKTTWKRMRRTLLDIRAKIDRGGYVNEHEYCQYNSYAGWSQWAVSSTINEKYLLPLKPAMHYYYLTEIKHDKRNLDSY